MIVLCGITTLDISHLIATGTRRSCMVWNLRTVIAGANSKPATSVSTSSGGTMKAPAAAQ